MKLLAIAYPELTEKDLLSIEDCRKDFDKMFSIVEPHFTFVFPLADFSVTDFVNEIKKQARGASPISFCLSCATINKDAFSNLYHTFLVPDEGFSKIVKLHNKLYSDKLSGYHRLDLDYIPHITVGNSSDKMVCKKIADEWNASDFSIKGIIRAIDIMKYENNVVDTIESIKLG